MQTLEERVAFLEGRVEEHARNVDGIREALGSLEGRMDRRFEQVDVRITALEDKMDRRFEGVDRRFESIEARFTALEEKLDRRFGVIEEQISRLTTSVMTALAAVVTVAGGLLWALK